MNQYIFYGLILPERANVFISKAKFYFPDKKIEIISECSLSKVISECSAADAIDLETLKNYVEMAIRTIVDSRGYTIACGYDVEIQSVYNLATKEWSIFGVHENIFPEEKINEDTNRGFVHPEIKISLLDLAAMSGKNMELQIALSDFREAIRQPNFTSFHCYRVIEALRHTFDGDKSKQWEKLRNTLQIDSDEITIIRDAARRLRHGDPAPQSWEDRKKHMFITWCIIKKYIDWRCQLEKREKNI